MTAMKTISSDTVMLESRRLDVGRHRGMANGVVANEFARQGTDYLQWLKGIQI